MFAADCGRIGAAKLLLAHPDVDANMQNKVNCSPKSEQVASMVLRFLLCFSECMDGPHVCIS